MTTVQEKSKRSDVVGCLLVFIYLLSIPVAFVDRVLHLHFFGRYATIVLVFPVVLWVSLYLAARSRPPLTRAASLISRFAVPVLPWLFVLSAPSLDGLERSGNAIVEELEAIRAAGNAYPSSLETTGVWGINTRHGPWRYFTNPSRTRFSLKLGDYRRDGFIIKYISEHGKWYRDT